MVPKRTDARSKRLKEVHRNIDALNTTAFALRRSDPVRGLAIAIEAQMLAKGSSYDHGLASSLCNQGFFNIIAGNHDRAWHDFNEAFNAFEKERDKPDQVLARTQLGLGIVAVLTERLNEGVEFLERSLRRARKVQDLELQTEALAWQGEALLRAGELEKGREHLEKGLALCDQSNDQGGRSACMLGLAVIRRRKGELARALLLMRRTAELAHREGVRVVECRAIYEIAALQFELGDDTTALELYTECITLAEELDARSIALESYRGVGAIHRRLDDPVKMIEYANRGLEAARSIGSRYHEVAALNGLGNIFYRLNDFDRALSHYTEALEIAVETGRSDVEEVCLENIGNVHRDVGEYPEAIEFYSRSRRLSSRRGNKEGTLSCYFNLGLLAIDRNDFTTAIQHLNTAAIGAEGIGATPLMADAHRELSNAYELRRGTNDLEKAFEHYKVFHHLSSELLRAAKDREIANIKVRADIERQEKEDALHRLAQPDREATATAEVDEPSSQSEVADEMNANRDTAEVAEGVKGHHPELSPGELQVCSLMLAGLDTQEMANLLGVTDRAIEKHRYKIRRKLALPRSTNLLEYLKGIS